MNIPAAQRERERARVRTLFQHLSKSRRLSLYPYNIPDSYDFQNVCTIFLSMSAEVRAISREKADIAEFH